MAIRNDPVSMQERIADLEERLQRMEAERAQRARGRLIVRRIVPAAASEHFRTAWREQLLGMRSLVDSWIGRMNEIDPARPVEREEIPID